MKFRFYDAKASYYIAQTYDSASSISQANYDLLLSQGAEVSKRIIARGEIASAAHAQDILTLLECDAEATNHMMVTQPDMMTILVNASY